jgi:uncharacterized membrane protein
MTTNLAAFSATVTLLAAGAMTGVFFAFSVAVMPGLDALAPEQSVAAMRSINEKILNPLFLSTFMGVPIAAGATGGLLLAAGHRSAAVAFFVAAGVYLLGAFLPTVIVNVPMNDALAEPGEAARLWADYASRWTAWNSARAAFSAVSLLAAGLGLCLWGRDGLAAIGYGRHSASPCSTLNQASWSAPQARHASASPRSSAAVACPPSTASLA